MPQNRAFNRGMAVGLLATLGTQAVHWLLTPTDHPDATTLRTVFEGALALAGWGGVLWVMLRQRSVASIR